MFSLKFGRMLNDRNIHIGALIRNLIENLESFQTKVRVALGSVVFFGSWKGSSFHSDQKMKTPLLKSCLKSFISSQLWAAQARRFVHVSILSCIRSVSNGSAHETEQNRFMHGTTPKWSQHFVPTDGSDEPDVSVTSHHCKPTHPSGGGPNCEDTGIPVCTRADPDVPPGARSSSCSPGVAPLLPWQQPAGPQSHSAKGWAAFGHCACCFHAASDRRPESTEGLWAQQHCLSGVSAQVRITLAKALVQDGHTKGFSPLCLLSWSFRWDLCLNACRQTGEEKPWRETNRWTFGELTFSHIWQANGLSLLWTLSCFFRSGARMNDFPQTSHL